MGRLLGELVHQERRNYHGSADIDYCSPGNPHAILSLTGFVSAFFDQAPPIARQARPEVPAEAGIGRPQGPPSSATWKRE